MAKTKNKRPGKPRGMNYADMLARKRMIREAVQEAADDATVRLRTDVATQKALWLAVCSVADAYVRSGAYEEILRGIPGEP